MLRHLVLGTLILTVLGLPSAARSQEGGVFGEIIEVRVVNLEVVVTDRAGARVPDLKPEDFRLRVDGQEVPIQYFSEVREGAAVAGSGEKVQNAPGVEEGQKVSTSYLVFVDDVFPLQRDRNRALDGLLEALPLLGPEDRMAVVAYNGRRLEMLSSWSQSKQELQRALERAKGRASGSLLWQKDREFAGDEAAELDVPVVDQITGATVEFDQSYQEVIAGRYVDRVQRSLDGIVAAVGASLRSFAKPPGRKVMLLLAGGWPYSPTTYFVNPQGPLTDFGIDRGPETFQKITQAANRIGYTLYPLDVGEQRGFENRADVAIPTAGSLGRETELHSTLEILADKTGGRAFLDASAFTALEGVISDTRSYYWLGFSPDWQGDDSDHKIKLEVLRPGLKVRAREGFEDLSRKAEVSYQVESALLLGFLPGSEPLEVQLGPGGKARRGRVDVPITLTIPMDGVTMLPVRGQYVAELELRVAVLDESGQRNELPVIPVTLAGPALPQPGQHAVYDTILKLRAQDHDLVLALYDPPSGRMLSTVKRYRYVKR